MTDAMLIIQSCATTASDLLLCIGALAFLWLVAAEDGL